MGLSNWMSWEGGVDLAAMTEGASQPNIIVHIARMVHTPVGSAPSGMVMIQEDPDGAPLVMGFVSTDEKVGAYFGPKIFAGTPFESAPILIGSIQIESSGSDCSATVQVAGKTIVTRLSGLGSLEAINRAPAAMPPFAQMALEATASKAAITVDGREIAITVPPVGISGGPAAVWSPAGIYCR